MFISCEFTWRSGEMPPHTTVLWGLRKGVTHCSRSVSLRADSCSAVSAWCCFSFPCCREHTNCLPYFSVTEMLWCKTTSDVTMVTHSELFLGPPCSAFMFLRTGPWGGTAGAAAPAKGTQGWAVRALQVSPRVCTELCKSSAHFTGQKEACFWQLALCRGHLWLL